MSKSKDFSYKNYEALTSYISDRARILPRKKTSLTPKQQRKLSIAIKRARFLGLLPYKARI